MKANSVAVAELYHWYINETIQGIITVPATGATSLTWLLYDGHGNMVRTLNTSFALSAFQWRGVWGERTTSTAGRGYCANLGHPEDETGLVYMRARYYEPTTGRFISEDPARDGANWYLYADGDPVGKVDASGRDSVSDVSVFYFLLGMTLASASIFGILESKTVDALDDLKRFLKKSVVSTAQLAIICFGISAVGLDRPDIVSYLIVSLALTPLAANYFWGESTSATVLRRVAGATVFQAIVYGMILYGCLLSIGAEL